MTMKGTGDNAFTASTPYGLRNEATYAGALSFLRRPYTRDLADAAQPSGNQLEHRLRRGRWACAPL